MENSKWYAAEYGDSWTVEDSNSNNILEPAEVGNQQAEKNAKLCASVPQMRELLLDMFNYLNNERTPNPGSNAYIKRKEFDKRYQQLKTEYGL